MISLIKLKQHKGLSHAQLSGLGKINVISGPNNSGKTTVLECIRDEDKNTLGVMFDATKSEEFAKVVAGNHRQYHSQFLNELSQRLTNSIWTMDDEKALVNLTEAIMDRYGYSYERYNLTTTIKNQLIRFIGVRNTTALVNAKRKLDTYINISAVPNLTDNGTGVLTYLFKAKNSPGKSGARSSFDLISQTFTDITGYRFDTIINSKNDIELQFIRDEPDWLKADDCGLGFRDLIIILYFALADSAAIILLEEPEVHLHPDIQRKLIQSIRKLSKKQFFISTHSNVFLSPEFADMVFSCTLGSKGVQIENATSRASLLFNLGYSVSDNLISDLVILCEGPSDKPVIEEFLSKKGLSDKFRIKIWPLGGDIMSQHDLSIFKENYRIIALIDLDPNSQHIRRKFVSQCEELKIPVHQLKRYSIENYFTIDSIEKATHQKVPEGIMSLDEKLKVSDQIGFDTKKNNREIARLMNLDDIKGTDFEQFFQTVEDSLKKS